MNLRLQPQKLADGTRTGGIGRREGLELLRDLGCRGALLDCCRALVGLCPGQGLLPGRVPTCRREKVAKAKGSSLRSGALRPKSERHPEKPVFRVQGLGL